ncbi:MAG: STAS domain-containing protein [Rhodospirillaceae bacterium]|nr:STAS domain-containing protein [Rhodospirillaceae bacterium]
MEVTCERRDGVLWFYMSGRINILNATRFEETVANAIEDGDRALILDLENLVYISSAGLYAVLRIAKIMWQRDAAFALCALSDSVHLVFERIGFTKIMGIHSTRAEALASLEG